MISNSLTISTYSRGNLSIWMTLAFQAGLINIGGLLSAKTFVSHVTGFVSLASLEFESHGAFHALGLITMLLVFLVGSALSGVLIDSKLMKEQRPQYSLVFGLMFLLTLVVAIGGFNKAFGEFGSPAWDLRGFSLVALLCLICGIQNGMITLVSKSVVRTTHMTGLTTDLGVGLVRAFNEKRLKGSSSESKANRMRIGIIVSFFLGSFVGVPLFRNWHFQGFIFPCLISASLFALTAYFQWVRPLKGN
ncbi:MAG: DUF1275 family protein [Bdellovibrionaceae bacterium]|nr:DUF1275 family protein [Pseudobdellovibrionaceae bacterium]|tara:strand:- start:1518 stop:2261 length:744 start_codon:yes stop_codon:yes gene_type:complete